MLVNSSPAKAISGEIMQQEFFNYLDNVITIDIPKITSVVPGYIQTHNKSTKLIIGNFTGDTENDRKFGYALGEVLRYDISLVAGSQLYMPGYHLYHKDSYVALNDLNNSIDNLQSIKRIANLWSIYTAVVGNIKISKNNFQWEVKIIDLKSDVTQNTHQWSGKLQNLTATINDVRQYILFHFLGKKESLHALDQVSGVNNYADLKAYGEFIIQKKDIHSDLVLNLALNAWNDGLRLPYVGMTLLRNLKPVDKDPHYYKNKMDEVANHFHHPNIQGLNASRQGDNGRFGFQEHNIKKLQSLVKSNPNNPGLMLSLADLLAESNHKLSAISVSKEILKKWPDLYRGWLSMGYSLKKYAWQLRGFSYWRYVPEKEKQQFQALMLLYGKASDNCYSITSGHSSGCIINKMSSLASYSQQLMVLFEEAVAIAPHQRGVYSVPLHYSAPKWGGGLDVQRYILEQAKKNNPDAKWIEEIRKKSAPDVDLFWTPTLVWSVLFLIIAFAGVKRYI